MNEEFGDRVAFVLVYVREAHSIDGSSPQGGGEDPIVEDPVSVEERRGVARRMLAACDFGDVLTLVDGVDDSVNRDWAAAPVRLYLVDAEGRVAWRGGPGPRNYRPEELEAAIRRHLARIPHQSHGSRRTSPPRTSPSPHHRPIEGRLAFSSRPERRCLDENTLSLLRMPVLRRNPSRRAAFSVPMRTPGEKGGPTPPEGEASR